MLSCRLLSRIGSSKMVSQISVPFVPPGARVSTSCFQQNDLFLNRSDVNSLVFMGVGRCFHSNLSKNPFFLVARHVNLQKNLFMFGRRCSGFGHLCCQSCNFAAARALMNWQKKQSFSCAQIDDNNGPVAFFDPNQQSNARSGLRISRTGRVDAQNALFDYLHCTRSLSFTDAEHVSKNCPKFLQKLLEKFEKEEDVGRSLARFLRYNPINEFEPFLESLGLRPSELYSFLPCNQMYLSDDHVLLENYQVLCNYGVPRSKIGKIYRDATDVFGYATGVLSLKLGAYEELGLSRPTIIKLVTCCPTLLIGDVNAAFLQVLDKLKSIGIELDWLRGCLSDKSTYNWNRILDMIDFLDRIGCTKKELAMLISENPRFIFDDSGKKIYVSVAMLLKLGLKVDMILNLFVHFHRILAGKFGHYLLRSVQFLSEIGMDTKDIARVVTTHPQVFGSSSCRSPNVVLAHLNISAEKLSVMIVEDPCLFGRLACGKKITVANLPRIEGSFLQEKTNFLLKLGFVENSDEMAKALSKFRGRGDQLQERFDCLVKIGLDCHTVTEMVKLVPPVLNQSIDVLEKKIDYLLNDLGYPLEALVTFPTFLCYNMERIKLRFSMFTWLKEHGVVRQTKNRKMVNSIVALSSVLASSEARFVKYFVSLHPEGPKEWERLRTLSSSS